jgi:hypothetical protein
LVTQVTKELIPILPTARTLRLEEEPVEKITLLYSPQDKESPGSLQHGKR